MIGQSGGVLDALGFTTSLGRTLGPWGGPGGEFFNKSLPVLGFCGGIIDDQVSGIGIYTVGPLLRAPPNIVKSDVFGNGWAQEDWDDSPGFEGAPPCPRATQTYIFFAILSFPARFCLHPLTCIYVPPVWAVILPRVPAPYVHPFPHTCWLRGASCPCAAVLCLQPSPTLGWGKACDVTGQGVP